MRDDVTQEKNGKEKQVKDLEDKVRKLTKERKLYLEKLGMLSSFFDQMDDRVSELFVSKRWKFATRIGEAFRKARFKLKIPMVEDYLGRVLENNKKLKNDPGRGEVFQISGKEYVFKNLVKKKAFNFFKADLPERIPQADIVVCVYNSFEDVKKCLESVEKNTFIPFRLIIVNDGSDKKTSEFLDDFNKKRSNCILISNPEPTGYTNAANQGLKASRADYTVLLNSDTIVPSFWLERIIECGQSDPGIGIIGPLSNAASWQSIPCLFDDKGDWAVNRLPENIEIEEISKTLALVSDRRYPRVPFINGFCFVIKREVLEKIGYLDEKSFPKGYGEENDFCLRASRAGFDLAVADHCYVYHAKSRSYTHEKRKELTARGGKALARKYPDISFSKLLADIMDNRALREIRSLFAKYEKNPEDLKNLLHNSSVKILFVLPVQGGGGGSLSVVQEVRGMRSLGFDAQVAIRRMHMADYYRDYASLLEKDENLFYTFENDGELINHAAGFNVVVATIHYSVKLVKRIADNHPFIMPAYYIQDYEPLFYEKGSEKWKAARDSYSLIPGMILMAKTDWLCDIVKKEHGLQVQKVRPSLDTEVFFLPEDSDNHKDRTVAVAAMVRPSSPGRSPALTMSVLKKVKEKHGNRVDIHIFGCREDDKDFLDLDRGFTFKNHGILTREGVSSLLRKSDIFIDLSTYQAFGRTGLEAMACGCAVILPQKGGVHEYAVHQKNALIVDTGSRENCFNALSLLVEDEKKRKKMAENGAETSSGYSVARAAISEISMFTDQCNRYFQEKYIKKLNLKRSSRQGKPKIHSLLNGSDIRQANGSYYIRHYQPFTHQRFEDKFDFSTVNLEAAFEKDCDLLVVQRVTLSDEELAFQLLEHCQKNGILTVYETDDHLFGLPVNHSEAAKYNRSVPAAKLFVEHADMVIASSENLKDNLLMYNKNVKVIPNALDERLWRSAGPTPERITDPKIRILYMGTYTHLNDLLIVEKPMKELLERWGGKLAFDVIGITREQSDLDWINPVRIPNHNYPKFVSWLCREAKWSIGIAPLEETDFNKCKSYIKYLDYAALGLVPVCSDIIPYRSVVAHKVNGLLADNTEQSWFDALNSLMENSAYRFRLAENAYQNFIENHTLKNGVKNWISAFNELLGLK